MSKGKLTAIILGFVVSMAIIHLRQDVVVLYKSFELEVQQWAAIGTATSMMTTSTSTNSTASFENIMITNEEVTSSSSSSPSKTNPAADPVREETKVGSQERHDLTVTTKTKPTPDRDGSSTVNDISIKTRTTPQYLSTTQPNLTNSVASTKVESPTDHQIPVKKNEETKSSSSSSSSSPRIPLKVSHKAVSGLGHRLMRQVSAWHFAKMVQAPTLDVDWGWCQSNGSHIAIFDHLFGNNTSIPIPTDAGAAKVSLPYIKEIRWDRNQLAAAGGVTGQRQNNANVNDNATAAAAAATEAAPPQPLPVLEFHFINDVAQYTHKSIFITKLVKQEPQFYGKDQSDEEFYSILRSKFRFMDRVRSFQQQHAFADYTVLGLHLRLGNGESNDFVVKNRGISTSIGQKQWLSNLGNVIVTFWIDYLRSTSVADGRPPLVFLSTDSSDPQRVINDLKAGIKAAVANRTKDDEKNLDIPVVTVPQPLIPEGKGVSYSFKFETKEECIESWIAQFVDMVLLTESDVVLPGLYSSFTQTMPLSYHLSKRDRQRPGMICNVGVAATVLECFQDYLSWFQQGKGGVDASRLTRSNRVIVGDLMGKVQLFDSSGSPMMPIHKLTHQKSLEAKFKDYPVSIIASN
jgi:hypothetical protein